MTSADASTTRHGSKADVAYDGIRERIGDGTYGPGSRLVLSQLAAEIGVSVVPVREALRRLAAEGYVDFRRNLGATVAAIDATAYGETMETLAILEATATSLAAPHLGRQDILAARRVNAAMADSLDRLDLARFDELNHELHEILYAACPNAYLLGLVERERARLRGIRRPGYAFVPDRAKQAVTEHGRLIDLIAGQAPPAEIEECARAHRMRTAHRFLERSGAGTAR
jgi:DNA-binding GntR family transcriptional regulator